MDLHQIIQQRREETRIKPKDLSRALGKADTFVSDWENKLREIDMENFVRLVGFLGGEVQIHWLEAVDPAWAAKLKERQPRKGRDLPPLAAGVPVLP